MGRERDCNKVGKFGCTTGHGWVINGQWFCSNHFDIVPKEKPEKCPLCGGIEGHKESYALGMRIISCPKMKGNQAVIISPPLR